MAKVRRPQHDNARRIDARVSPEPAVGPSGIAGGIRGRGGIDGVLRRRGYYNVLNHRRRRDRSVVCRRWRLALGKLDVLELADPIREGFHLGLARSLAGRLGTRRDCRRALVRDARHANPVGRSQIADVDRSGRIDPRIDIRVSKLQPKRAGENRGQGCTQQTSTHQWLPITTTAIVGLHIRVV